MFDIGWIELAFIAVLALLIVGPKDLPKLLKLVGMVVTRARKFYRRTLAGINSLEREIQIAEGKGKSDSDIWRNYVPEEIRHLPADFQPGSMTAEQHEQRRQAFEDAKERAMQIAETANSSATPTPKEEPTNAR